MGATDVQHRGHDHFAQGQHVEGFAVDVPVDGSNRRAATRLRNVHARDRRKVVEQTAVARPERMTGRRLNGDPLASFEAVCRPRARPPPPAIRPACAASNASQRPSGETRGLETPRVLDESSGRCAPSCVSSDDKGIQSRAERFDEQRPFIEPLPRAAATVVADQSRLSIGEAREKHRTLHRRSRHDRPIGDLLPVWEIAGNPRLRRYPHRPSCRRRSPAL